MLKKFLSGSGIFALSVLAFSVVRQIIVFPAISRIDDQLFASLTFMVFTLEAIAYGFTGAIPDYYVRQAQGSAANAWLMRQLSRFCLLGVVSVPAFYLLGMGALTSSLLGLYLYLFALNALKIKLVFNKLCFGENFIYMGFRSAPYLLALWIVQEQPAWLQGHELPAVAMLMLAFEFIYWLRLVVITQKDMLEGRQEAEQDYGKLLASLLPFIASALLIGVIQRGDMTLVKLADTTYYTDYAKTILTINFFCAPLSLMISAPLLSLLSNRGLSIDSPSVKHLLLVIFGLILLTSIGATGTFNFVHEILYGGSNTTPAWLIFYLTTTTLLYALARTMVVKYAAIRLALPMNILLTLLAAAMSIYLPVQIFIIIFFGMRLLAYIILLALDKKKFN
ncbi:hypothetical protein [Chromohalobacter israelensis]|uniref:hypothetical protein n=1 Tax=Chromohalobacter israelensis TaxID=141390 RepID=UPI000D709918|nr:hypothetical protein [Chromohalobacter salexigens]PWW38184.1 hypothetical protein DFO74_10911 [Chromohalobacter salexigens]